MFDFVTTKIFLLTAIFVLVYVYLKHYVYAYWKRHGIPHETPSIPFGNIPISYFFGKIPIGILIKENCEKFRKHPFHGFYILNKPTILINDPELIRLVLVKEFSRFNDRGWFCNEKIDPMTNNLFLQSSGKWKRLRRKFTPTFTPGKLRQMYPYLLEIKDEMIKTCERELDETGAIEMKDIIVRYTTDIVSSLVYGFNCNSLKNPDDNEFLRYGEKAFEFGRITMIISGFFPELLDRITIPFYHKTVRDFFTNIFCNTINYRRENNIKRNDFITLLLQLMDRGTVEDDEQTNTSATDTTDPDNDQITMLEAAAQAFIFFLAGFETSSSTVTYCLLELALNIDVQLKLQEEIDKVAEASADFTFDSLMDMEYLDMVFNETLRKYSALSFLNRKCMEEFPIPNSNFIIPKGMQVLISTLGVHHNPKFYPDPEKFDPSRFAKENLANRSSYVDLGFGKGPRNCIGQRFGILETKLAIATIAHNYDISLSNKTKLPIEFVTESFIQTPRNGIYLKLKKRK